MTDLAKVVAGGGEGPEVVAVFLLGSEARGETTARSDAEACLLLRRDNRDPSELFEVRLGRFVL